MVRSAVRKSPLRGTLDTVEEVSYVTLSSVSGLLLVCAIVAAGFWVATIYESAKSDSATVNAWRFGANSFLSSGSTQANGAQLTRLTLDTMFQSIVVALLLILVAVALRSHGVFMS